MGNRWVWAASADAEAPIRLICFAHAGGGSLFFRSWRPPLLPEIGVVAVVLPGREARVRERPVTRLDELLPPLFEALRPWADRPFALLGHSLGAIVAYETARLFCASPLGPPLRLFVSGRRGPHVLPRHALRHTLADRDLVQLMTGLNGTPAEVLGRPELAELFLPSLRADLELNETYTPQPGAALSCPVSALGAYADPEVRPEAMAEWATVTSGEFSLRTFPGDHFYLKGPPADLVAAIRNDLGLLTAGGAAR